MKNAKYTRGTKEETRIGPDSVRINWVTDEYATGRVLVGPAPGSYMETVSDPQYYTSHAITLDGLAPGSTYYYRLSGADRSGNGYESEEHALACQSVLYLPMARKR